MAIYPKSLRDLIDCLKKMPSIGEKSAERMAFSIMNMDIDQIKLFSQSLLNVKNNIKKCKKCNNLTESEFCDICNDNSRNGETLCVVESPKNVILFEKIGSYNGKYHILNGLISPLDGITPNDIDIKNLINRVETENIKEIIIAVKPSIEGETTALYISKIFENYPVVVSKIAHGVPLGTDMEYIDALTLELALEDRKKISDEK
ncbi:MAG: recombination protein RecR [Firmicutes bacterium]|nr:recombination protein RecR [Bacillota bacterium]